MRKNDEMDFFWGDKNDELFRFYQRMLVNVFDKTGGRFYLLHGQSGCGKTTFAEMLQQVLEKKKAPFFRSRWYTCENIIELLKEKIEMQQTTWIDDSINLIVIDNLEELCGRTATLEALSWEIERCLEKGCVIVGITTTLDIDLLIAFEKIFVSKVTPTVQIVKEYAKSLGLDVSLDEAEIICQEAMGSFSRIRGLLLRNQLFNEVEGR